MNRHSKIFFQKLIAAAFALFLWQAAAFFIHSKILLIGPVEVAFRLLSIWQEPGFWNSVAFSFVRICGGFLLGMLLGLFLAVCSWKKPVVQNLLWPWMATIKSVPVASFIVICLIWLSAQRLSVFISFLIVLPVCYQNLLTALQNIDSDLMDAARMEQMGLLEGLRLIVLPVIAPQILSTASLCAGMAWKSGIAAEIIGTPQGAIGQQLYLAKIYLDTDDLLAWTVVIVILALFFEKSVLFLLRKAFRL